MASGAVQAGGRVKDNRRPSCWLDLVAEHGEHVVPDHGAAAESDVDVLLYLALSGPALDLLDGVGPHPEAGPAAADVPAAGRDRRRPVDTDVLAAEEVQGLAFFDARVPEALDPEDMEQAEPVVGVLEIHVGGRDTRGL